MYVVKRAARLIETWEYFHKLAALVSSQDFPHTFSMALYHKWNVKNGFAYVLQFFSLISESLGGVGFTALIVVQKYDRAKARRSRLCREKLTYNNPINILDMKWFSPSTSIWQ